MGYKLSSYAYWWIRRSILMAINQQTRSIRLPFNVQNNATKVKQLEAENYTVEEISKSIGVNKESVEYLMSISSSIYSLSDHEYDTEYGFDIDHNLMQKEFRSAIDVILTEDESKIIALKFRLS